MDYLPILAEERPRVFISYAWENRRVVGRIRNGLIERGIDAWMDADPRKGIHGGQSIPGVVKRKIRESRFSLVCFSSQALRKEGWVHQEWRWILERAGRMPPGQHYAIPIKLNRCEIPSDLDFEATRYLKLGRDLNRLLDQLAYEIHSHSGQHDAEK